MKKITLCVLLCVVFLVTVRKGYGQDASTGLEDSVPDRPALS